MNDALPEGLLSEEEGSTLDFKRDQYPSQGASEEQRSELLKDILAFANATPWRGAEMKWLLLLLVLVMAGCDDDGLSPEPAVLRNKIVFTSDRDGYSQLYVMNTGGTGVKLLPTPQPGAVLSPVVSPDGRNRVELNGDILR